MNEFPILDDKKGNIPLFYPNVPSSAAKLVSHVLKGRWIGQGPLVDEFEEQFEEKFGVSNKSFLAVNSGTSALHLGYLLAGIIPGDEVICPVFTCTATNLALLYIGAVPKFYDVNKENLNASLKDIEKLITKKTKAIVTVDYGGLPNDYKQIRDIIDNKNIRLIADLAHCIDGKIYEKSILEYVDFAIFSFQAIKTLTTADGGMLVCPSSLKKKAKRLRWFGIDRERKQQGIWENDIYELGYKYQMTDVAAAIGIAGLSELNKTLRYRKRIFNQYLNNLQKSGLISLLEATQSQHCEFTPWLATINCKGKRVEIMNKLREINVESAQVHYRNDRYSIFKKYVDRDFPNMDLIEDDYLVLPLHHKMTLRDVDKITRAILQY